MPQVLSVPTDELVKQAAPPAKRVSVPTNQVNQSVFQGPPQPTPSAGPAQPPIAPPKTEEERYQRNYQAWATERQTRAETLGLQLETARIGAEEAGIDIQERRMQLDAAKKMSAALEAYDKNPTEENARKAEFYEQAYWQRFKPKEPAKKYPPMALYPYMAKALGGIVTMDELESNPQKMAAVMAEYARDIQQKANYALAHQQQILKEGTERLSLSAIQRQQIQAQMKSLSEALRPVLTSLSQLTGPNKDMVEPDEKVRAEKIRDLSETAAKLTQTMSMIPDMVVGGQAPTAPPAGPVQVDQDILDLISPGPPE